MTIKRYELDRREVDFKDVASGRRQPPVHQRRDSSRGIHAAHGDQRAYRLCPSDPGFDERG